ncbi:hypothetical protein CEQ90_17785 [Lewinellaceae bacterium SD302]|nr:hypothetical protein CEQ90_17785 [Lewinellaceae bacterium SD302]
MKQKYGAHPDRIIYKGVIYSILLFAAFVAIFAQYKSSESISHKILDGFETFLLTSFGLLLLSIPLIITFGVLVYRIIATKYKNSIKRRLTALAFWICSVVWSFIYRGLPFNDLEEIVTILILATGFSVPTIISIYSIDWLLKDNTLYDDILDQ